jgi:hypothetical protein
MKKQTLRVRFGFVVAVFGMAGAAVGCGEINDPVRPSALPTGGGAASIGAPGGAPGSATSALASPTHRLSLTAVAGSGSGIVNVTANARGGFTANTRDAINVHGVSPNTVLYVRAAADVGLPGGAQADGICQRADLGQFQPLLAYPGGPPAILETSAGGAGATHVVFGITNPFVSDGGSLDLVLRLVDALPPAVPTIDLRTACFTLEIK